MKKVYDSFFLKVFSFILLSVIHFSCNRHTAVNSSVLNEIIVFPAPPDTAKIQFLTKISSSQDIIKPRSKFAEFIEGKQPVMKIIKPYGIFSKSGKLYITDTGILGLHVIDFEKKGYAQFIPEGRGKLTTPINCFIDDRDFLYVADSKRNQVVVYNKERRYINAIGDTGLFRPTDVFVYDNKVFIPNIKNHKVNVFKNDSVNTFLYSFPESEPGNEDYLYSPANLFVKNSKVYVSDVGGFNVKVYTIEGKYLQTFGSFGKASGQFSRNRGVAVDHDENVFVVDASFDNVQIFNKEAQLLMFFGGPYTGIGYMYLPAKIFIDYDNLEYFQQFVDPSFDLKYLIFVTNQYGPDKITVYGRVEPK